MKRAWFALAVGIVAGSVLVGTASMAGSRGTWISEDEVQARKIWELLRITPDLEDNRITVDVEDGIAVLEGSVDSYEERKTAQQLAHVEGILGVNNRLKILRYGREPRTNR
jgi:osmotically-inducible protein OsmY